MHNPQNQVHLRMHKLYPVNGHGVEGGGGGGAGGERRRGENNTDQALLASISRKCCVHDFLLVPCLRHY